MKVPDYRQESYWRKMGLDISRQYLNNWGLKCTEYYFKSMYDLLKSKLLAQPVLHADETYSTILCWKAKQSKHTIGFSCPASMTSMASRCITMIRTAAARLP